MKCLTHLQAIERKWQSYWNARSTFMAEPPLVRDAKKGAEGSPENKDQKFFVTFPYPYMNGRLHLGHLFSATRSEFAAGYHMVCGHKTLFPFGFHVTGMPICGAAKKLADEIDRYGCPPIFPVVNEADQDAKNNQEKADTKREASIDQVGQFKAKKNKLNAKTVTKSQWEILVDLGVPEKDIPKFVDPYHWVKYFPKLCYKDMRAFGARVDWRRSMITTDANPYYDRFIQWQFNKLYADGYIKFGKRNCIWSPVDGQACMDHDRYSGEGVQPQEYVGIKLELINYRKQEKEGREQEQAADDGSDETTNQLEEKLHLKLPRFYKNPKNDQIFGTLWENQVDDDVSVYLVAATLRPETMVGQTNCWVLPSGEYGAYYINHKEVVIVSKQAAVNMAHQGLNNGRPFGETDFICKISGADLLLATVKAPLTPYKQLFVLPLETIKMDKGTGIVTSVPSDAPDDYACYKDILNNRGGISEKYGIDVGLMLEPYSPLPIIEIPEIGTLSAVRLCDEQNVASQHDKTKLIQIKEMCYTKGFYTGVMKMGPFAGQAVKDCKQRCKDLLIELHQCIIYSEPESEVISRSNCVCVVASADQWYLDYGNEAWKEKVRRNIEVYLNTYSDEVGNHFMRTVDNFREWAASRSFGLGTALPFDKRYVIESLSDSTIYNAYYTIAHYLQGNSLDGTGSPFPLNIIDDAFFNYVFDLSAEYPSTFLQYFEEEGVGQSRLHDVKKKLIVPAINSRHIVAIHSARDLLDTMRESFRFWYPVDLRCSGKDLIPNHLTMMLYNHTAIWPNDETKWPRGMRANGHLQLNDAKMSKAAGNFLTANEAIHRYGADAVRFALADAGDGLDDANFKEETANNAVLRLHNLLTSCQDLLANSKPLYSELYAAVAEAAATVSTSFLHECVFFASIADCVARACLAFEKCNFREGLIVAFNELIHSRDQYVHNCETKGAPCCSFLIEEYIAAQSKLLAVICPHIAEELHSEVLGKADSIFHDPLPPQEIIQERAKQTRIFLKIDEYVQATIVRLKAYLVDALKPRKDGTRKLPNGAKSAVIYVASSCPEWQERVSEFLAGLYADESDECGGPSALPKDAPGRISKYCADTLGIAKKDIQRTMKYAAQIIAAARTDGADAFVTKLPFSEKDSLLAYAEAIKHALGVEKASFYAVGEGPVAEDACKAATPGKPIVFFE